MISGRRAIENIQWKPCIENKERNWHRTANQPRSSMLTMRSWCPRTGKHQRAKPSSHTRTPRVSHALLSQSRDADARGIIDWLLLLGPHQFHGTIELGRFHLA
jgi:hypothetical protein